MRVKARFSELPDGRLQLDLSRFNAVEKDTTAHAA